MIVEASSLIIYFSSICHKLEMSLTLCNIQLEMNIIDCRRSGVNREIYLVYLVTEEVPVVIQRPIEENHSVNIAKRFVRFLSSNRF